MKARATTNACPTCGQRLPFGVQVDNPEYKPKWRGIDSAPKGVESALLNDRGLIWVRDWGQYHVYNSPHFTHWMSVEDYNRVLAIPVLAVANGPMP